MRRRYAALFALMITGLFILAACADPAQPTATNVPVNPTAITGDPSPTPGGAAETPAPAGTPTALPAGDPATGQALFNSNGCSSCHSTGPDRVVGPGLAGVAERAATRIEGMTADEYMHQSIVDSRAFIVPGFDPLMPPSFSNLTETDVNNLIAYLKTLH